MAKSITTYWNALKSMSSEQWQVLEGCEGKVAQLTLSIDHQTGNYTRLTRFTAGADTSAFGVQCHDYPEEIFVVKGRLYDKSFQCWLEAGDYASRPPGELHGPFICAEECLVLEVSFPGDASEK